MEVYDLYKPLRNQLRKLALLPSLEVVHAYIQHFQFGRAMPANVETHSYFLQARSRVDKQIFEWELELLARELIVNASTQSWKNLRQWAQFSSALNGIKNLENAICERYPDLYQKNIILEFHRIAHRQFPWQQRPSTNVLARYYRIFGVPSFDPLLRSQFGMGARELYTLGLLFTGYFIDKFALELPINIGTLGIPLDHVEQFVTRFSIDLSELRAKTVKEQSLDQDFAYTFNPLQFHPLIKVIDNGKWYLVVPIPTYLFRRFTEGVYFEICGLPGFADAFGKSFQAYVGEVVEVAGAQKLDVKREQRYKLGKAVKDGADWIASDKSAHIFIECKTKKLRFAAKMELASTDVLDEELDKMSGFVVQLYKTIFDALDGHYPDWQMDNRPIYPMIVTLEEWYAFGDRIVPEIDNQVREKLQRLGLDDSVLDRFPYTICAVADFENAVQVMCRTSIDAVMRVKVAQENRQSPFRAVLHNDFGSDLSKVAKNLFPETLNSIVADVAKQQGDVKKLEHEHRS